MKYRHEFKYFISAQEIAVLKTRLSAIVPLDSHVGPDGRYTIRSLYFDSITDRCFWENEGGSDPREKFRIRIYNGSPARIALECKRKEHGKTLKTSCTINRDQCESLMRGELPGDVSESQDVLRKLMTLMQTELFRPKIIVEYDRIPYVYRLGNVRITFDTNIRSSTQLSQFLEKDVPTRPILQSGEHLLEVKYDEFLPDYIKNVLELGTLSQTAFSKYYLCRKFNTGGIL
ncbi:MAG: polyphosphate polymerase domain-containing protein [Clostridia bacterium]|nr:polyphosphate polymerase domain-containing protein [Clostridia bacterium]